MSVDDHPSPVVTTTTTTILQSQDEIDEYAKNVGVKITFSTLGPGYRAVARADHDPEQILGYCEGFVRPGKLNGDESTCSKYYTCMQKKICYIHT